MDQEYGCYVRNKCCVKCEWWQRVGSIGTIMTMVDRDVCPECGGDLNNVVGRFIYIKEKKLFGTKTKIIGFQRKQP